MLVSESEEVPIEANEISLITKRRNILPLTTSRETDNCITLDWESFTRVVDVMEGVVYRSYVIGLKSSSLIPDKTFAEIGLGRRE